MLGFTPLAFFLRHRAKRLFRLPLSPLGSEPLHLKHRTDSFVHSWVLVGCWWGAAAEGPGPLDLTSGYNNTKKSKQKRSEGAAADLPDPQARPCERGERRSVRKSAAFFFVSGHISPGLSRIYADPKTIHTRHRRRNKGPSSGNKKQTKTDKGPLFDSVQFRSS